LDSAAGVPAARCRLAACRDESFTAAACLRLASPRGRHEARLAGGRALGLTPTANTGYSFVDAFLWVKPPGEADGCADKAGTFDPALAAALASNPAGGTPNCKVTYAIASAWTGGFTANVTVANTGTQPFGMQGTWSSSNAAPTSFTMTANNGQTVTCSTG
jgi:endoglucanase